MKRKHSMITLLLVLVLSAGLLTGCGSSPGNTGEDPGNDNESDNSITADNNVETELENDVVGEVSYIGTYYISVKTYISAEEIENYVSLDISTLTESDRTDSVNTDSDTEYYQTSGGSLVSITREDIAKGDMIAAITTQAGVHQIIVLEKHTEETTDPDVTEPS